MKELLEQRLKIVLKRLGEVKADTVEHTELVKEMAALIKTIADLEKAEKAKQQEDSKLEFDRYKLSFDKEKFEFERTKHDDELENEERRMDLEEAKMELERNKFTQQQAEKLIETQDNQEKKWWERGFTIGKFILRGIEITVAIIALKYEIFNHISGKADWEAIRNVFKGE